MHPELPVSALRVNNSQVDNPLGNVIFTLLPVHPPFCLILCFELIDKALASLRTVKISSMQRQTTVI